MVVADARTAGPQPVNPARITAMSAREYAVRTRPSENPQPAPSPAGALNPPFSQKPRTPHMSHTSHDGTRTLHAVPGPSPSPA